MLQMNLKINLDFNLSVNLHCWKNEKENEANLPHEKERKQMTIESIVYRKRFEPKIELEGG